MTAASPRHGGARQQAAHREATLYHALAGAGAGDGRSLAELREARWRPTSRRAARLAPLGLLDDEPAGASTSTRSRRAIARRRRACPRSSRARCPSARAPGVIVQSAGAVVHVELDPALAEQGVILCSLRTRSTSTPSWSQPWYSQAPDDRPRQARGRQRRVLDAAARSCTCPHGVVVEDPFQIVYAIDEPGHRAVRRARCVVGEPTSEFRVHEYDLARRTSTGQALHAGAFELYLQDGARCRLAQLQDWGARRGVRRLHALRRASGATPTATGCRRYLGGHLDRASTSSSRSPSRAATWPSAACSSPRATSTSTLFAVDLHETGPSGGDVHWRGAATGESPRELRGADPDRPGRAADRTPTCRSTR